MPRLRVDADAVVDPDIDGMAEEGLDDGGDGESGGSAVDKS